MDSDYEDTSDFYSEEEEDADLFPKLSAFMDKKHEISSSGELPTQLELSYEEKNDIIREIRQNFSSGKLHPDDYGTYYGILYEIGASLDPLDEFLLNPEYNVSVGLFPESTTESELDEIERQARRGHNIVLMFARLNSWASKVVSRFERIPILKQFGCHHRKVVSIFQPETEMFEQPEFSIEENLAIINIFKNLYATDDGAGLCYLFKSKGEDKVLHFEINLDEIETTLDEMTAMYREVQEDGKPIPFTTNLRNGSKPIDFLVENAVTKLLSHMAVGMKGKEGWHNYFHSILQKTFGLLSAAVQVDIRFLRAITKENNISVILDALIDEIQNCQNQAASEQTPFTGFEAEYSFFSVFSFISNLYAALYGSKTVQLKSANFQDPIDEKTQRFLTLSLAVTPSLLRAVSDENNPILCSLALELLQKFTSLVLPEDVTQYLLKKSSWAVLISCLHVTSSFIPTSDMNEYPGHYVRKEDGIGSGTEVVFSTTQQVRKLERLSLIMLLRNMCLCTQRLHDEGVRSNISTGKAGLKLIKRGFIAVLLQISNREEEDDEVMEYVAEILQCLTRTRDCRVLMLSPPENLEGESEEALYGLPLVSKLLNHRNANVVSHALLMTSHLLWDSDWQPVIASMTDPFPIEVISAAMAVSCIQEMERFAEYNRKGHGLYDSNFMGRNEKSQVQLDHEHFWNNLKVYQKHMHGGNLYPIFGNKMSVVLMALARCVLLFLHLSAEQFGRHIGMDTYRERLNAVKAVEFLVACVTFHTHEIDQYSCNALVNLVDGGLLCPKQVPDPQRFVTVLLEQLAFLVDMDFNDATGGRSLAAKRDGHFTSKLSLIGFIQNSPRWEKILKKSKKHLEDIFSAEQEVGNVLDNIISLARDWTTKMSGSHRSKISMPSFNTDLLQLRACANPCCRKVEVNKGDLKQCGKCKVVCYCSRKCQSSHWKAHKKQCKSK